MSDQAITRTMIEQYLHEALPSDRAAAVEKAIRDQPALLVLVAQIRREGDHGEHSVGAIWRRARLTCPSREELLQHLEDILPADRSEFIDGHIRLTTCHLCMATLDDLKQLKADSKSTRDARRKRIVESTAGVLAEIRDR